MALAKKERDRLKTKYGEWALVTGASSGMGMELAKGLARGNLTLSINARNEMVLNKSAQEWAISIRRKWKWLLQAIRNQMEFQNLFRKPKRITSDCWWHPLDLEHLENFWKIPLKRK